MHQIRIRIKTPKHNLKADCYLEIININEIKVRKKLFYNMCMEGCRNFNNKYCCPPSAPRIKDYVESNEYLITMLLKLDLNQLPDYKDYHKLRVANAVLKSRIEKIMRHMENKLGGRFLSTGSCRLCHPCRKKKGEKCAHPEKMRHSMEALGIDCNHLSTLLFNIPLLWYKNKKAPEYTSVICALPVNTRKMNLKKLLNEAVKSLY